MKALSILGAQTSPRFFPQKKFIDEIKELCARDEKNFIINNKSLVALSVRLLYTHHGRKVAEKLVKKLNVTKHFGITVRNARKISLENGQNISHRS